MQEKSESKIIQAFKYNKIEVKVKGLNNIKPDLNLTNKKIGSLTTRSE